MTASCGAISTKPFFSWRHALINCDRSELAATTRHVLLTLSCHMNTAGESCYPSIKRLSRETGLSPQTVMKHLSLARAAGWISVRRHGFRGQTWRRNEYAIAWPSEKAVNQVDREMINHIDPSTSVNSSKKTHQYEKYRAFGLQMLTDLRKMNPEHREPPWPVWLRDTRAMCEQDGRTLAELYSLWQFVSADQFWRSVILSPGALRDKWDRLQIKRGGMSKQTDTRCIGLDDHGERCKRSGTFCAPGCGWLCFECREAGERTRALTVDPSQPRKVPTGEGG